MPAKYDSNLRPIEGTIWSPPSLEEKRRQAATLRRYVREHDWHMSQDDIDRTLEMASDLEKEVRNG